MSEADYWRLNERYENALAETTDLQREIEVLTTERDNALLRIEELETRLVRRAARDHARDLREAGFDDDALS